MGISFINFQFHVSPLGCHLIPQHQNLIVRWILPACNQIRPWQLPQVWVKEHGEKRICRRGSIGFYFKVSKTNPILIAPHSTWRVRIKDGLPMQVCIQLRSKNAESRNSSGCQASRYLSGIADGSQELVQEAKTAFGAEEPWMEDSFSAVARARFAPAEPPIM